MGQKVNPIISRLGEITYWKQQYFEKKSNEIATYSLKSLEIKNIIHNYLKVDKILKGVAKILFLELGI